MNLSPRILLLAGALLAGCEAAAVSPPLLPLAESIPLAESNRVPLAESNRAVKHPTDAPRQPADPQGTDLGEAPSLSLSENTASLSENTARSSVAPKQDGSPRYTVRKAIAAASAQTIPPVLLSGGHAKLCIAKVGDAFPALSLPMLGGENTALEATELAALRGQQATVVLFWHPDRWMARTALTDMQRDIAKQFDAKQVAVVGIASRQPPAAVQAALTQARATFPQLLDTDGQAFSKVGTAAFPRLYVLDPAGKIVWFDIEYSEGTRRELWQTLQFLTKP